METAKIISELKKVKKVISDPTKWLQNKFAVNKEGLSVHATDKDAICFCTIGAFRKVSKKQQITLSTYPPLYYFREANGLEHIPTWNDDVDTKHSDVMKAFDKAIEHVKNLGDRNV